MSYLKTKGIVIREVNTGEADKMLTVFTKSNGRVSVAARGARRPRSRMVAGTQLLCYSDFVLFEGKRLYTLNSCEAIETFYNIRMDLVKLTYAAHMTELINDAVQDNQPSGKILQLFLNTLHFLSKTDRSPELLTRVFELRLMSVLGFAPHSRGCMLCGRDELDEVSFSFRLCGFICGNEACARSDPGAVCISPGTARALRHIVYSPPGELFGFSLSEGVMGELAAISRRYVRERMEKDYTKLDFLKELRENL